MFTQAFQFQKCSKQIRSESFTHILQLYIDKQILKINSKRSRDFSLIQNEANEPCFILPEHLPIFYSAIKHGYKCLFLTQG